MSKRDTSSSVPAAAETSPQPEPCPLCPDSGPPVRSTPSSSSSPDKVDGEEQDAELVWIACTRCSTWYHSPCVLLGGDESRSTVPAAIREEIAKNHKGEGEWYNWTEWIDKWYCAPCLAQSISPTNPRPPRHPLTATLKRGFPPIPPASSAPTSTSKSSRAKRSTSDRPSESPAPKSKRARQSTNGTTIASADTVHYQISDMNGASPVVTNGEPPEKAIIEPKSERRPKRNVAAIDYHNLNNSIATPTSQWLDLISDPAKYGRTILDSEYKRVPGKLITRAWLEGETPHQDLSPSLFHGDEREPIITTPQDGGFASLGGQLPGKDLTVQDVSKLVGPDRPVHVIDVATQQSSKWTLGQWAAYVKSRSEPSVEASSSRAGANKVYNIISLEISGTELAKRVKPPTLVREIDWVDNFWPTLSTSAAINGSAKSGRKGKEKSKEVEEVDELAKGDASVDGEEKSGRGARGGKVEPYPKVQLYCLMGMKGSWTDWHVDFAASSVYYTIHTGSKVFYFIRPTPANLKAYADWSGSYEKQQEVWLGDVVDEVRKVVLKAGDTMIIPSGYIHAVYTPLDSIVFGGNFIHSYNIPTQLRLRQIEIDTKVPQQFRFPMFDKLCWYVADKYTSDLRHLRAYRSKPLANLGPPHPHVLKGLLHLADFLISQTDLMEDSSGAVEDKKRKLIHDRVPSDVRDASGLARELRWRVTRELGETSDSSGSSSTSGTSAPSANMNGMGNQKTVNGHETVKEESGSKGKKSKVFEKKPLSRTWQFDPPAWEKTDHPVQIDRQYTRLPRPSTTIDAEDDAEITTRVHRQTRRRVREDGEGVSVLVEEQEEVFTEKRIVWGRTNVNGRGRGEVELQLPLRDRSLEGVKRELEVGSGQEQEAEVGVQIENGAGSGNGMVVDG